jgi:hypothetical protein
MLGYFFEMKNKARRKPKVRKLLLYWCACCRSIWHKILDERSRRRIETLERFVDGLATEDEMDRADASAKAAAQERDDPPHWAADVPDNPWQPWGIGDNNVVFAYRAANCAANAAMADRVPLQLRKKAAAGNKAAQAKAYELYDLAGPAVAAELASLLRDVVGNPFRRIVLKRQWLVPAVRGLAGSIYDDRNVDELPVLADALEEAGCEEPSVLEHCRGNGKHVRGCWVIDLILNKTAPKHVQGHYSGYW